MKNFTLIFTSLIVLSLTILSCNDDESDPSATGPPNAELEGTIWVQQSSVAVDCDDPDDNEEETCLECDIIKVNTDGTITIADNDGISLVPYTKSGNTLTVDIGDNETMDVTYIITGNTMTVTFTEDGCNVSEVYQAITESLDLVATQWNKRKEIREDCPDSGSDCDDCDFTPEHYIFSADGSVKGFTYLATYDHTYTVNGNEMIMEWLINGDTLSLEIEFQIISDIMQAEYTDSDSCKVTEVFRGYMD